MKLIGQSHNLRRTSVHSVASEYVLFFLYDILYILQLTESRASAVTETVWEQSTRKSELSVLVMLFYL